MSVLSDLYNKEKQEVLLFILHSAAKQMSLKY